MYETEVFKGKPLRRPEWFQVAEVGDVEQEGYVLASCVTSTSCSACGPLARPKLWMLAKFGKMRMAVTQ